MTRNARRFVLGTSVFIVGLVAGVVTDACVRGNVIQVQVNGNGSLSLAPNPGDKIHWFAPELNQGDIRVKFQGPSPCGPNDPKDPPGTCTIRDGLKGASFAYGCDASKDPELVCTDPGVGPISRTCGHGCAIRRGRFGRLWENLELFWADFMIDLHGLVWGPPGAPSVPLSVGHTGPVSRSVTLVVACVNKALHVYPPENDSIANGTGGDAAVNVNPGDRLGWIINSGDENAKLTFKNLPVAKMCQAGKLSATNVCVIADGAESARYTVSDTTCPATSSNEEIDVKVTQPQQN